MPASLRRATCRSLGHFKSTGRPVSVATASASATPAVNVSSIVARAGSTRARAGARTTDTYRPAPGGENQVWPRRPRPAVCSSATTTRPCDASEPARVNATSFVDPVVGRNTNVDARRPRRARARSIAVRYGTPSSARLDLKADVDRGGGVRERADRDVVAARGLQFGHALERDAAGDLDLRAPARARDRVANLRRGHVVDENNVGAGRERVVHLIEPLGLDLDRHAGPVRARLLHCRLHAAGESNVVVFDE